MIDADNISSNNDNSVFIEEDRTEGYILVEAILIRERDSRSFRDEVEEIIETVADVIGGQVGNSDAQVDEMHEVDGSILVIISFENATWGETLELIKMDEYQGKILLTRLRLHGETRVRTVDFVRAYGFYKFVEEGYLIIN
jgi:hypothetical protein